MVKEQIEDISKYPNMVSWFNPLVLIKVLQGVILSAWFGRYADQRVIQGASDKSDKDQLLKRADLTQNNELYEKHEDSSVWVDYVADVGDGFDSTYAVAYLLAQQELNLDGGLSLPRASTLIIGGDLVYPDASRQNYWERMRRPYMMAFPDDETTKPHPRLFAIPGNHDWYDGLAAFHGTFCRARDEEPHHGGLSVGNWRCKQYRSYFAIKLPHNWWIWGVDSQLAGYVDQPQVNYFRIMADALPDDAKVIICTAVPSWIYAKDENDEQYRSLKYIASLVQKKKGVGSRKVKAFLAGDLHHYSRYESDDKGIQLITAGGGGAFTHSTHTLKSDLNVPDIRQNVFSEVASFSMGTHVGSDGSTSQSCYPSQKNSLKLLNGNLWFPFTNIGFAVGLGFIYWIASWFFTTHNSGSLFLEWISQARTNDRIVFDYPLIILETLVTSPGLAMIVVGVFVALYGYADAVSRKGKLLIGFLHSAVHITVFLGLAIAIKIFNTDVLKLIDVNNRYTEPLASKLLFAVEMIVIGGFSGGFIFGFYLYIMSRWFKRHMPDASSALRIQKYRNFLRLKLSEDSLTIYPIGLDNVPKRSDWKPVKKDQSRKSISELESATPLEPFLIEPPIVVEDKPKK